MYILPVAISEKGRLHYCDVLSLLNFVYLAFSLGLLALGAQIRYSLSHLDHIYIGFDDDTLPLLLVGVGSLSVVSNIIGGLVCYTAKVERQRPKTTVALRAHVIVSVVLALVTCTCAVLCFVSKSSLSKAFERGIRQSMEAYGNDPKAKNNMDVLQMDYRCCGNGGYKDWFITPWILDR